MGYSEEVVYFSVIQAAWWQWLGMCWVTSCEAISCRPYALESRICKCYYGTSDVIKWLAGVQLLSCKSILYMAE